MGRIVVTENATLDGVIGLVDDWFSPAGGEGGDDSDILATTRDQIEEQDAFFAPRTVLGQMGLESPRHER
jgi:hypothetical protein